VLPRSKKCRRVLERRTGLAIPRKAIRQSALHDIRPVHEPAERGEVRADADQLGVIAVGVTGAIIQRHIPQLARADAGSVLRPRSDDLRVGKPDLLPDGARVCAYYAIPKASDDAVGISESDRRATAEVAPQPQQIHDWMIARGRCVRGKIVIDGADVCDRGTADLAGQFGAAHGSDDASRVNQGIRCVELLESLEEEWPLLRKEQREPLVHRDLADVGFDL